MTDSARAVRTLPYVLGLVVAGAIAAWAYRSQSANESRGPPASNGAIGTTTQIASPVSERNAISKPPASQSIHGRALRRSVNPSYPRAYTLKLAPMPEEPVLALYQSLKPLADAGDTQAAVQLFQATMRCILLPRRDGTNSALDHIERDLDDCPGVGQQHIDEAFRLLLWAAESGNDEARLEYANSAFFQYSKPSEFLEHPNFVSEYRERYLRFLEAAISQGNVTALANLANSYRAGGEVDADPFKAYAYEFAMLTVQPEELRGNLDYSAAQLTPEQIAAAQRLAAQIVKRCCE